MKTGASSFSFTARAGFTMIEMIGVMAIMAILAAIIAPAGLRSIERSAVRAEASTLKELSEQIRLYARDTAALPGAGTWTTDLTGATRYSSLSAAEALTNKRQTNRLYVVDAANQRALIISSMRTGVALPSYAQVSGSFQSVWDTPADTAPTSAGWGAWNGANAEFLLIERINCRRELQTFPITLKNSTPPAPGTQVSYVTAPLSGSPLNGTLNSGVQITVALRTGDRINLYRPPGAILDYTYVVGSRGASFEFNGTTWFSPSSP
jgi:prepilin-type N-terminal cleavage/methylation domain-containing protein